MKKRRFLLPGMLLTGLLLPGLMLMTFGCNLAGGKVQVYDTTSIDIAIGSPGQFSAKVALGTYDDVVRVTMEVAGEDKYGVDQDPLVPEQDLVQQVGGEWTGTITGLPVGPVLTFRASGYDSGDVKIFSGELPQTLTGIGDLVTVAMDPIDDGIPIMFPRVLRISLPAEIVRNTSADVDVDVQGTADEAMSYEFSSESGGGAFTPNLGGIVLSAVGEGTIVSNYSAPPVDVGDYTQTVKVINSQGNSVEVDFDITVVYDEANSDVGVLFAPVVVSLNGKRTGDDVTWTAVVEDDITPLNVSYLWGFTQLTGPAGVIFIDPAANPAVLSVYDQTVTGVITLSVTDGSGLMTTITFDLVVEQFPDDIIEHP